MRRLMAVAAFVLLAACSPPAQQGKQSSDITAGDVQTDPLAIALAPVLTESIGLPVSLSVRTSNTQGDWGWLVAQPWTTDWTQIDWLETTYAERAREGVLDGNGVTYALLKREGGQWRVVEFAVGPTDVAWADWAERHGAPASLMVMPAN